MSAAQVRLGDLYDEVARLVLSKADDAIVRSAVGKLVDRHGEIVAWVLGVIREDMEASGR